MTLRFDQPWILLGLLVCMPMAWAALRWFVAMSAARRWSAILLRVLLFGALLGMLAGASMVRRSDRVAVIACVDMSGSVRRFYEPTLAQNTPPIPGSPQTVAAAVEDFLKRSSTSRRPDDLAGVVVFGERPVAAGLADTTPFRVPEEQDGGGLSEGEDGTNIERALRLAGAMIPPDAAGRIILFSDGVQTQGDAEAAARALAGSGSGRRKTRVDVVPFTYTVDHEVTVDSVDSPPTAQSGATVPVRVVISATERCTGTLDLTREGLPVDINGDAPGSALRLTLEPGRNIEVFKVPLPEGRIHRFEAIWTPDPPSPGEASSDTVLSNNRAASVTIAPGRGAVLIVDGVSGGDPHGAGANLGQALARAGLQIESVGPDALKNDLLWLQQFDLIILQNVGAETVARSTHEALATCVTQLGAGLIMVGGPDSFGAGGWKGTAIEPILPVKLDLPEKLVTPAAAVILVIDNSGSMNHLVMGSNRSQQDIADEGAALAVESMDKTDLVGVVTFNSDFTVDVPLGPNSDPKATAKLIRAIGADGGTNMPPALAEAHTQIKRAHADVKHVIVLSDGVSLGKEQLPGMVEDMAADGIMVSTVAIGNEADVGMMRDMAGKGKGQFYRVIDPTILPRVLLKAVRIVHSPLVREGAFTPVVLPSGSPVMEGLSGAFGLAGNQLPPLRGVVLTQARVDPTVVYPLATPKREGADGGGEPLLGYWNVGIGRVAAFTSDAQPKWAGPWLDAKDGAGYSRFWTQLARVISRPPSDRAQELTAEIEGDHMTVRLRASEESGKPIDALAVPGSIYGPRGEKTDVRLSQVGPGEYEQTIDLSKLDPPGQTDAAPRDSRSYVVTLSPRRTGARESGGVSRFTALPPVVGGVTRPAGEEYRRMRSDVGTLQSVADITGGSVFALAADSTGPSAAGHSKSPISDLFSRAGIIPAESRTPLWPALAIAAVGLMLLDVATRRVAWDRLLSREMGAEVRRGMLEAMRDRTTQTAAAVGRLRAQTAKPTSEPSGTPTVLGDADAEELRDRERARRRAAKTATFSQTESSNVDHPSSGAAPETPTEPPGPDESGLMAAKRRAQRRMDEG